MSFCGDIYIYLNRRDHSRGVCCFEAQICQICCTFSWNILCIWDDLTSTRPQPLINIKILSNFCVPNRNLSRQQPRLESVRSELSFLILHWRLRLISQQSQSRIVLAQKSLKYIPRVLLIRESIHNLLALFIQLFFILFFLSIFNVLKLNIKSLIVDPLFPSSMTTLINKMIIILSQVNMNLI